MTKWTDQFKAADETTGTTMTLINKQGKERAHSLNITVKKYPDNIYKYMLRFTSPENVRGTGLLIAENLDRNDDMWFYLPALKKIKKISSSERNHSFMGSEFSYEDLRREVMRDNDYKLIGNDTVDGYDCYLIEAVPSSSRGQESGYGKRHLWVRKDIFFKIKTEYYDKTGKLLKTEADEDIEQISGGRYRMNKVTMLNDKTGNKTILTTGRRVIDSGIPDSKFTTMYLEKGA